MKKYYLIEMEKDCNPDKCKTCYRFGFNCKSILSARRTHKIVSKDWYWHDIRRYSEGEFETFAVKK